MIKPGLYTYKNWLQCAEILKINGKLHIQFLCALSGGLASHQLHKDMDYRKFLKFIGEV